MTVLSSTPGKHKTHTITEIETVDEGELSEKEIDQTTELLADWLIDIWLKKHADNSGSERSGEI